MQIYAVYSVGVSVSLKLYYRRLASLTVFLQRRKRGAPTISTLICPPAPFTNTPTFPINTPTFDLAAFMASFRTSLDTIP